MYLLMKDLFVDCYPHGTWQEIPSAAVVVTSEFVLRGTNLEHSSFSSDLNFLRDLVDNMRNFEKSAFGRIFAFLFPISPISPTGEIPLKTFCSGENYKNKTSYSRTCYSVKMFKHLLSMIY